jgi:GntR family transcriptional repressor for pyruvate dehydrogenase complex
MDINILVIDDNREVQNRIISQIRDLINYKNLEPGDKLPSERMLSEKFGVSRNYVRESIQKLEYYGLLKSIPQSGTFVADIGAIALNGMVDEILSLNDPSFKDLVETRILLELKAAGLAALRRTTDDLLNLETTLNAYEEKDAVQEDLLFHLGIAKISGNTTLNKLMLIITPGIITNFEKYHICDKKKSIISIEEHRAIFDAIKNQDSYLAKEKMKVHFAELYKYINNV